MSACRKKQELRRNETILKVAQEIGFFWAKQNIFQGIFEKYEYFSEDMIGEVAIPPARKLEDLIRFVYLKSKNQSIHYFLEGFLELVKKRNIYI